jgi:hypothetical protein
MSKGTPFMRLGKSFLDCARYAKDGFDSKALRMPDEKPLDFLLAHSAELMLKGCILQDDPEFNVLDLGHRLSDIYKKARCGTFGQKVISATEEAIQEKWRKRLIFDHNSLREQLALSPELESELGVPSETDIEKTLCHLQLGNSIEWLDEHSRINRNLFRYPINTRYKRHKIDPYNLSDDIVWNTVFWGCSAIYSNFLSLLRNK